MDLRLGGQIARNTAVYRTAIAVDEARLEEEQCNAVPVYLEVSPSLGRKNQQRGKYSDKRIKEVKRKLLPVPPRGIQAQAV